MTRYVVTGAHGFVGRALCAALAARGASVTGLVRRAEPLAGGVPAWVYDGADFAGLDAAWPASGPACDVVIHLAARVHVMHDAAADPLAEYRAANLDGLMRVARGARAAGARRFVMVSSIKALGDADPGRPWCEDDAPRVLDAYGRSKREAEDALLEWGRTSGMETVVMRPPLVHGPGVRANFLRLLQIAATGLPLPLGAVTAKRSLVSLANLVDALILCATHEAAPGRVFHVADSEDLTTADLVRTVRRQLGLSSRLVPVPPALLAWIGRLTGRTGEIDRLIRSLRVDSSRIRRELGWLPPLSAEQGLQETVSWYRSRGR
jgi:UDP-glucose 4-epimerase